jgi:hypothetical protein
MAHSSHDDPGYPTPAQMIETNREMVELVRQWLPQRYYGGEAWRAVFSAAALVRMADTVDSMMALLERRLDADALTLLRSLYEQVITLAWIAIDPEPNHKRWLGNAKHEMLKLHNDAAAFGETILTATEATDAKNAPEMPNVADRAKEADEHWPDRVKGLHPDGHLLSFRGLYLSIYRLGSRPTHGAVNALDDYVTLGNPVVVDRPDAGPVLWYALAAPLFGIGLMIAAQSFNWLDEDTVRATIEKATQAPHENEPND